MFFLGPIIEHSAVCCADASYESVFLADSFEIVQIVRRHVAQEVERVGW